MGKMPRGENTTCPSCGATMDYPQEFFEEEGGVECEVCGEWIADLGI